jgi:hypothetical protein
MTRPPFVPGPLGECFLFSTSTVRVVVHLSRPLMHDVCTRRVVLAFACLIAGCLAVSRLVRPSLHS